MPVSLRRTVDPLAKRKVLGASPMRVYPMCDTVGASARSVFAFLDNRARRRRTLIERNCATSDSYTRCHISAATCRELQRRVRGVLSLSTGIGLRRHGTRLTGMNTMFIVGRRTNGRRRPRFADLPGALRLIFAVAATSATGTASASIFEGETLDMVANIVSWVVLIFVPIVVIVVFWLIHVLPEKIAHKRHHPQRDAIQTLCLLSLFFGGLLWPIAWLWAYTKPVGIQGRLRHREARGVLRRDGRKSSVRANCCARKPVTCAKSWRRWKRRRPAAEPQRA